MKYGNNRLLENKRKTPTNQYKQLLSRGCKNIHCRIGDPAPMVIPRPAQIVL